MYVAAVGGRVGVAVLVEVDRLVLEGVPVAGRRLTRPSGVCCPCVTGRKKSRCRIVWVKTNIP